MSELKSDSAPNLSGIPVLEDIVVPGKALPDSTTLPVPVVLTEEQMQRLSQEIEEIVQAHLNKVLQAASKAILKNLKTHIDEVLPDIVEEIVNDENYE
ncbi:MAG: hypothetical protein GY862_25910 [Gammaproteobacteria bacterium]|nr:hypothetical protein [Gammaproteobacteria bacterium]